VAIALVCGQAAVEGVGSGWAQERAAAVL